VTREKVQAGHTLRFTVTRGQVGWDVREERDSHVVRTATYTDWHRVERAIRVFEVDDDHSTNR
jgi:hypothetical protein